MGCGGESCVINVVTAGACVILSTFSLGCNYRLLKSVGFIHFSHKQNNFDI